MKNILITGSLGYIGSVLSQYLQEKGYDCNGYDTGFFRDCILYPPGENKTIIKDAKNIGKEDLQKIDVVVHLAGISNNPFGNLDPSKIYDPTRAYSDRIAKLCKDAGTRFIFASSCSVYGIGQNSLLDENSQTNPQTPYALNKLQIEQDLEKISDSKFSPIALRFATVFGPSPRIRFDLVVNMLVGMALTSGKIILNSNGMSWRPSVHILDVCKAINQSIDLEYNEGCPLILNVGETENNLRVIDIANIVKEKVDGTTIHFLKNNPKFDNKGLIQDKNIKNGVDTRTYKVSFEKVKKYLNGFECDWSVEKGIENMIDGLERMNLTETKFKDINFYRLQKIEYLLKQGYLSDELVWKNNKN